MIALLRNIHVRACWRQDIQVFSVEMGGYDERTQPTPHFYGVYFEYLDSEKSLLLEHLADFETLEDAENFSILLLTVPALQQLILEQTLRVPS